MIHAGDDNLVVKGLDKERLFASENILFDDVLTVSNSAATKIGTETGVEYFKNITFRNIDVVKCKRALTPPVLKISSLRISLWKSSISMVLNLPA